MSGSAVVMMETVFNISYLVVVWCLILAMVRRWSKVDSADRKTALSVLLAFVFLALGDMGHVGFRVVAFAMGGLDAAVNLFGREVVLAPLGSMATAWTFTLFYVCMVFMWKYRFRKSFGPVVWGLFALAVIRSIIMLLPGNSWNSQNIQEPFYTLRNLPLIMMQTGTAYLILRDAIAHNDTLFKWIGAMIVVSLVCYAPIIALIKTYPNLGMLMIPKTIAYLVIAYISLKGLFPRESTA